MSDKCTFNLSYDLMTQTTEKMIKRHLEHCIQSDENDLDKELIRARAAMELWYKLALVGSAPFEILDRDRLHLVEMVYSADTDRKIITPHT